MHTDLREELPHMMPSLAREIIDLVAPRLGESHLLREAADYEGSASQISKPGAKCTVKRFVQFAYCEELFGTWAPHNYSWTALSFGGNGYDDWSRHIGPIAGVIPELFDCFDSSPVPGVKMHNVCVGGKQQRKQEEGRHNFESLGELLKGKRDHSVLVKLDIEGSEFDVLRELEDAAMRKIAYLTVEFHFLAQFGTRCCGLKRVKELLERLGREFIVIDGAAMRWGKERDCQMEGGYNWPNAISVSYVAREFLLQTNTPPR